MSVVFTNKKNDIYDKIIDKNDRYIKMIFHKLLEISIKFSAKL